MCTYFVKGPPNMDSAILCGNTMSGNVANAQAAACRLANNVSCHHTVVILCSSGNTQSIPSMQVMMQQASTFMSLKNANSLASAKISLLVSLTNGSFGLAIVADQLMIVEGAWHMHHFHVDFDCTNLLISNWLQSLLYMRRVVQKAQNTCGHLWRLPLAQYHISLWGATNTLDNSNFEQWNVWWCEPHSSCIYHHLPSSASYHRVWFAAPHQAIS